MVAAKGKRWGGRQKPFLVREVRAWAENDQPSKPLSFGEINNDLNALEGKNDSDSSLTCGERVWLFCRPATTN